MGYMVFPFRKPSDPVVPACTSVPIDDREREVEEEIL